MAQKLLLFWRKPARRCWWEGVELDNVEGVDGQLKVWIRRVWTLEMVSQCLIMIEDPVAAFPFRNVHASVFRKAAARALCIERSSLMYCLQSVIGLR